MCENSSGDWAVFSNHYVRGIPMYCKALLINAVQFAQECSDKAEVAKKKIHSQIDLQNRIRNAIFKYTCKYCNLHCVNSIRVWRCALLF